MKCKISVIIPVFNREKLILRCLNSLKQQTYKNYEVIIVDDGSKDKTYNVVMKYIKLYNLKNFYLIKQKNDGQSSARNNGIKNAKGKYLTFIDSDDFIENDYLEKFVICAEENNADIVIGGFKKINDINKKIIYQINLIDSKCSKFSMPTPWARIFKKTFVKKFDIKFEKLVGEDILFNFRCYSKNPKIKILNYSGYNWINNNSQSVSKVPKNNLDSGCRLKLCQEIYGMISDFKKSDRDFLGYFFVRFLVISLLFLSGKQPPKIVYALYKDFFYWITSKKENFLDNKYLNPFIKLDGEIFSYRFITIIFIIIHKFHLSKIFLSLYTKLELI